MQGKNAGASPADLRRQTQSKPGPGSGPLLLLNARIKLLTTVTWAVAQQERINKSRRVLESSGYMVLLDWNVISVGFASGMMIIFICSERHTCCFKVKIPLDVAVLAVKDSFSHSSIHRWTCNMSSFTPLDFLELEDDDGNNKCI